MIGPWNNATRTKAKSLRASGWSQRAISAHLEVPQSTIAVWLRGEGETSWIRECKLCGESFATGTIAQDFCSKSHYNKHRRIAHQREIDAMRAELERLRSQGNEEAA